MLGTGAVYEGEQESSSSSSGSSSSSSSPLGGMCFKACGMEDIQYAARVSYSISFQSLLLLFQSAGDLLQSARLCLLISTFIILLSLILLTSLSAYLIYRRLPPRSTPSIVHTLFPDRNKSTASTWTSLPFPISSFSWFVYLFPFPSQVLMISLGYLSTALSQFTIPVDCLSIVC